MANSVSIKLEGMDNVERFMKKNSKEVVEQADKAIIQATFFIEGEVKASIAGQRAEPRSVDAGRFLNSVKGMKTSIMKGKVETNVPYAKFLEWGTSRLQPRHHFTNTAKRNEKKVKQFVETEIKKISN